MGLGGPGVDAYEILIQIPRERRLPPFRHAHDYARDCRGQWISFQETNCHSQVPIISRGLRALNFLVHHSPSFLRSLFSSPFGCLRLTTPFLIKKIKTPLPLTFVRRQKIGVKGAQSWHQMANAFVPSNEDG